MSTPAQGIPHLIDTAGDGAARAEIIVKEGGVMAIRRNIANPLPGFVA
jgi:hypothetical protein